VIDRSAKARNDDRPGAKGSEGAEREITAAYNGRIFFSPIADDKGRCIIQK